MTALDRLRAAVAAARAANGEVVRLGRVVVPPHSYVNEKGQKIDVEGYTYWRKGGKKDPSIPSFNPKDATGPSVLRTPAQDDSSPAAPAAQDDPKGSTPAKDVPAAGKALKITHEGTVHEIPVEDIVEVYKDKSGDLWVHKKAEPGSETVPVVRFESGKAEPVELNLLGDDNGLDIYAGIVDAYGLTPATKDDLPALPDKSNTIPFSPAASTAEAEALIETSLAFLTDQVAQEDPEATLARLAEPEVRDYLEVRRAQLVAHTDLDVAKGEKIAVARQRGRLETLIRASRLASRMAKGSISAEEAEAEMAHLRERFVATDKKTGAPTHTKVFPKKYPVDGLALMGAMDARYQAYLSEDAAPSAKDVHAEIGFDPDAADKKTLQAYVKSKEAEFPDGKVFAGGMTNSQMADFVKYDTGLAGSDLAQKYGPGDSEAQKQHLVAQAKQKVLISKVKALANKAIKESQAPATTHALASTSAAAAHAALDDKIEALRADLKTAYVNAEGTWQIREQFGSTEWIKVKVENGSVNQFDSSTKFLSLDDVLYALATEDGWTEASGVPAKSQVQNVLAKMPALSTKTLSVDAQEWIATDLGFTPSAGIDPGDGNTYMAFHAIGNAVMKYYVGLKINGGESFAHPGNPDTSLAADGALESMKKAWGKSVFAHRLKTGAKSSDWTEEEATSFVKMTGLLSAVPGLEDTPVEDIPLLTKQAAVNTFLKYLPKDLLKDLPEQGVIVPDVPKQAPVPTKPSDVSDQAWELSGYLDALDDSANPFASLSPLHAKMSEAEVSATLEAHPYTQVAPTAFKEMPLNVKKGLLYALQGSSDPDAAAPPEGLHNAIAAKAMFGTYEPVTPDPVTLKVESPVPDTEGLVQEYGSPEATTVNLSGLSYMLDPGDVVAVDFQGNYLVVTPDHNAKIMVDEDGQWQMVDPDPYASKAEALAAISGGEFYPISPWDLKPWVEEIAQPDPIEAPKPGAVKVAEVKGHQIMAEPGDLMLYNANSGAQVVASAKGATMISGGSAATLTGKEDWSGSVTSGAAIATYINQVSDPKSSWYQTYPGGDYLLDMGPGNEPLTVPIAKGDQVLMTQEGDLLRYLVVSANGEAVLYKNMGSPGPTSVDVTAWEGYLGTKNAAGFYAGTDKAKPVVLAPAGKPAPIGLPQKAKVFGHDVTVAPGFLLIPAPNGTDALLYDPDSDTGTLYKEGAEPQLITSDNPLLDLHLAAANEAPGGAGTFEVVGPQFGGAGAETKTYAFGSAPTAVEATSAPEPPPTAGTVTVDMGGGQTLDVEVSAGDKVFKAVNSFEGTTTVYVQHPNGDVDQHYLGMIDGQPKVDEYLYPVPDFAEPVDMPPLTATTNPAPASGTVPVTLYGKTFDVPAAPGDTLLYSTNLPEEKVAITVLPTASGGKAATYVAWEDTGELIPGKGNASSATYSAAAAQDATKAMKEAGFTAVVAEDKTKTTATVKLTPMTFGAAEDKPPVAVEIPFKPGDKAVLHEGGYNAYVFHGDGKYTAYHLDSDGSLQSAPTNNPGWTYEVALEAGTAIPAPPGIASTQAPQSKKMALDMKVKGKVQPYEFEVKAGDQVFKTAKAGNIIVLHPDGTNTNYKVTKDGEVTSTSASTKYVNEVVKTGKNGTWSPVATGLDETGPGTVNQAPAPPPPGSTAQPSGSGVSFEEPVWDQNYVKALLGDDWDYGTYVAFKAVEKHAVEKGGIPGWLEAVQKVKAVKNIYGSLKPWITSDGAATYPGLDDAPPAIHAMAIAAYYDGDTTSINLLKALGKAGYYTSGPGASQAAQPWDIHLVGGQINADDIAAHWTKANINAYLTHHGLPKGGSYAHRAARIAKHLGGEPPEPKAAEAKSGIDWPSLVLSPKPLSIQPGAHEIKEWEDQHGRRYLSKPHTNSGEGYRGEVETAANQMGTLLGFNSPEAEVMKTPDGHVSVIQVKKTGDDFGPTVSPSDLTDEQLIDAMAEHILDWGLSNHDTHSGNLRIEDNGKVYGIDKGQAWKFFGDDKLAVGYLPPGNGAPIWYDRFYKEVQAGKVDKERLDKVTIAVLKRAREFSSRKDAEYRALAEKGLANRPGWKSVGGKDWGSKDGFIDGIMARKKAAAADFEKFYADLYAAGGYGALPEIPKGKVERTFTSSIDGKERTRTFHGEVSADFAADVAATGVHGTSLMVGGQDFEDAHLLMYTTKSGSQRTLNAETKLLRSGDSKMMAWLATQDVEPKGTSTASHAQDTPSVTLPLESTTWERLLATIKSHNARLSKGDTNGPNPTTLAALESAIDDLKQRKASVEAAQEKNQLASGFVTGEQQMMFLDMADDYEAMYDTIKMSIAKGTKVPTQSQYSKTPKPFPTYVETYASPQDKKGVGAVLHKTKDGAWVYTSSQGAIPVEVSAAEAAKIRSDEGLLSTTEITTSLGKSIKVFKHAKGWTHKGALVDGDLVVSGKNTDGTTTGTMYEIQVDGVSIRYSPISGHNVAQAQQGRLHIEAEGFDGSETKIEQAMEVLRSVGLDVSPATEESMEVTYWRHLAYLAARRAKGSTTWSAGDLEAEVNGISTTLDAADQIKQLRAAWAKRIGQGKVDTAISSGYHMPRFTRSRVESADRDNGKPYWLRPDIDVKAMLKGLKSQTPAGSYYDSDKTPSVLLRADGNGSATGVMSGGPLSSEQRLRVLGQSIAGDSSYREGPRPYGSASDQDQGSSDYVFTRRSTAAERTPGATWLINPLVLLRTTTYSFHTDRYGATTYKGTEAYWNPADHTTPSVGNKDQDNNETMIKGALSVLHDVEVVHLKSAAEVSSAIQYLKSHGITEIRGVPVEERIMSGKTPAQWRAIVKKFSDRVEDQIDALLADL